MKIVQVTPYYPPYLGGMQSVIKEITLRLAKKGHNVEIFTSDIGCEQGKIKSTKNLKINYLKSWEFAHTPIIPSLFFKLMRISKDSIIHVHIAQAFVPEIVWLVSKLRGIQYVAHLHTDVRESGRLGFLLNMYKKIFLKRVLSSASKIIVLSNQYKEIVNEKYNLNTNIEVIPNGVSNVFLKDSLTKSRDIKNILFVGRLTIEKNVDKIIQSMELLKHEKVNLNIVGDGELKINLSNQAKKKGMTNINFLGRKNEKELVSLYKKADLVLLPSAYEGMPLVLLEAMASGVPIIASDIPGTRSIIKHEYNGLLVKPTPEEIAKAIERLMKDRKLRETLAKNGLKEVKKYSWEKIVEQTEEVYREVLNEHKNKQN